VVGEEFTGFIEVVHSLEGFQAEVMHCEW
jgi:hypothetical protein